MNEESPLYSDDNYNQLPQFECSKDFNDNWIVYDLEVFSNCFTGIFLKLNTGEYTCYRLHTSDPKEVQEDNFNRLIQTLVNLQHEDVRMCGFRNLPYDYPVLHFILNNSPQNASQFIRLAKEKNDEIINGDFQDRFKHVIWENDRLIPQVDLSEIHHFSNKAKMTSLKALEFEMRLPCIMEAEVDFNKPLPLEKVDGLIEYNIMDVRATAEFAKESVKEIKFREELKKQHPKYDWLNASDSKIGSLIMQIEYQEEFGWKSIYETDRKGNLAKKNGKTVKKQSPRKELDLGSVIFDYIKFERPEFKAIHNWFKNTTVKETKGALTQLKKKNVSDELMQFMEHKNGKVVTKKKDNVTGIPNLHAIVDDVKFVFGTGGLHASVHDRKFESTEDKGIYDWDVKSFYANLSISNTVYPEHLGAGFCPIYGGLYEMRKKYPKGSVLNAAYKLALNSVYGNSNNKFSIFYDPLFTMTITINGQLSLCMLVEMMEKVPGFEMIQANTDGITFVADRSAEAEMNKIAKQWENLTKLELENVKYSKMFIHNVNNYIAQDEETGKIKRKGRLCARIRRDCDEGDRELQWHQDASNLVSKIAAEKFMFEGTPVEETIKNHECMLDFAKRVKITRNSKLIEGDPDSYKVKWDFDKECLSTDRKVREHQKVSRYYVSITGNTLVKHMPPRKKKLSYKAKEALLTVDIQGTTKKFISEVARDEEQWTEDFTKMCEYLHICFDRKQEPDYNRIDKRYHEVLEEISPKASPTIIEAGSGKFPYQLKVINDTDQIRLEDLDLSYYIEEANKLVIQ